MQSPAVRALEALLDAYGPEEGTRRLERWLDGLTPMQLAGLRHDWAGFWARPKQLPPSGDWLDWGFLTARGFGKTDALARFVVSEIESGRVRVMGMAAQNEIKTYDVNVLGLIEASPPRFVPRWIDNEARLVWPDGATAYVFTPEAPANIRSKNLDLAWLSELQSWPAATREEAYMNFRFATRKGGARMIWDATPKRGHPILLRLLEAATRRPDLHHVVRGRMVENIAHLAPAAVAALMAEFGGTTQGREELEGEMLTDEEGATVTQAVIDANRVPEAPRLKRRVISVDPSTTARQGSDPTGIADAGLGFDGRAYVLGDYSGKLPAEAWGALVVDLYLRHEAECVVVETNKGGDLVAANLRAEAGPRGLSVVVLPRGGAQLPHNPRVIYVREVYAQGAKDERARPVGTAYERGRVSHVGRHATLEQTLTSWAPGPHAQSPGDLDALVHAVVELLGLAASKPDPREAMRGILDAQKALMRPAAPVPVTSINRGSGSGGGVGGWGGDTI